MMGTHFHRIASWIAGLALTTASAAGTLRVPNQYATIADAIAAAHNGDRIVVADGVYSGPGNRDLDFAGKRIRISSANGPTNCIIDCQASVVDPHRAFHFHSGEPPAATLEGFTIQQGVVVDDGSWDIHSGGGVLCEYSSPTIRNCIFRWNTAAAVDRNGGGGLASLGGGPHVIDCTFVENAQIGGGDNGGGAVTCAYGSRPSFTRCTFSRNRASLGGAVIIPIGSRAHFRDCVFTENTAESSGGGLAVVTDSAAELDNCLFQDNVAEGLEKYEGWGGGLSSWNNCELRLENCRFIHNDAGYVGGGIEIDSQTHVAVRRCVFSGNRALVGGGGGGLGVGLHSSADVAESLFSGNSGGGDGGALVVWDDSDLTVRSSSLVGNAAIIQDGDAYGGAMCAWTSRATFLNSIVYGNTGLEGMQFGLVTPRGGPPGTMVITVASSLVQDGQCGVFIEFEDKCQTNPDFILNWAASNLDAEPLLARLPNPGLDGQWGTPDDDFGDLHLLPGSPCIDAGDPTYLPRPGETDIDGDPRVLDGNGDGDAAIDIGADEFVRP